MGIFAAITGLVVWASVAREPLQDKSLFDAEPKSAQLQGSHTADEAATPMADKLSFHLSNDESGPALLDTTVRALKDEVNAIGGSTAGKSADATRTADDAIARVDAALAAAGIPPPKTPNQNNASVEKLTAVQARLDRLRN